MFFLSTLFNYLLLSFFLGIAFQLLFLNSHIYLFGSIIIGSKMRDRLFVWLLLFWLHFTKACPFNMLFETLRWAYSLYTGWMFVAIEFFVVRSRTTIFIHSHLKTSLYFRSTPGVLSCFFHSVPYSEPSFMSVTVLHYNAFSKAVCNEANCWPIVC
jgi:hypothetical protein